MGRLRRFCLASALALAAALLGGGVVAAFDGFGASSASSTYGDEISFSVTYTGSAPDRLELLIRMPGSESAFVVPVAAAAGRAHYTWDTSLDYVTPNTLMTFEWRARVGDQQIRSAPESIRYVDDRPGLEWRQARLGDATVHWYGGAEQQARRFGELTAFGVQQAEELLGTTLAGPVDVFVYSSEDDFFGALGPGAREWTGAAAYSDIRTIFMWLGGGSAAYLEQAMVHEVTHIVFHDATRSAFGQPARWLNEGFATWAETLSDDGQREIVEAEARDGGLFAFDAISEQFPIGSRGAILSYAQGTSMVQLIVDRYGTDAIAAIMAAYRDGANDAEALEAGTGTQANQLYADFYDAFGSDVPMPVTPDPILPSNVERPAPGHMDPGGVDSDGNPSPAPVPVEPGGSGRTSLGFLPVLAVALALGVAAALAVLKRARRADAP